ncbi:MAG: hypothetical protein IIA48_10470 [Bacteroidetes bacterium]|nr:hypothetical protein [Bacteroidota bacterium]
MPIKFETTIEYRDDKKKIFEGSDHPTFGDRWLTIYNDKDNRIYIPMEAIKSIKVKDYWDHGKSSKKS